jgi:hypothetical protein
MRRRSAWFTATLGAAAIAVAMLLAPGASRAAGDWKTEFEAVCSKTDSSMTLTSAELEDLIVRCDGLAVLIGAEDEITKKVFLKRLQRCRDLFAYVLEQRKADVGAPAQPTPAAAETAPSAPPEPPAAVSPATPPEADAPAPVQAPQPAPAAQ